MIDLSILVPGIRPHNWARLYQSIAEQMKDTWQIVFVGPFDPPDELRGKANLVYIKSYDRPTVAMQKGMLECEGLLTFHTVDDGYCLPNSLEPAIVEYGLKSHPFDIVNGRYKEGAGFSGGEWPIEAWKAGFHADLRLPYINPEWNISLQPLFLTDSFKEIGGFNCSFEYSNHAHHDLVFRFQRLGGKVYQSPTEICCAGHMPGHTGDHGPIHDSQTGPDQLLFNMMYSNSEPPTHIEYDNYKMYEGAWTRRFAKEYKTYEEMMADRGWT